MSEHNDQTSGAHADNAGGTSEISQWKGRKVVSVDIEGISRIEKKEIQDLLYPDLGGVLDMEKLKMGIRRAFRKGIFNDIRVYAEPRDGEIGLKYVIDEIPVIDRIIFEGNHHVKKKVLKDLFYFKEGDDFREESLLTAKKLIQEYYRKKGYPDVDLNIKVTRSKKPGYRDMLIQIKEGGPVIVEAVDVPDEVRHLVGDMEVLDTEILQKSIKKIEQYYKDQNYIKPVVGPFEYSKGILRIPVRKGPKLEITFINNSAIKAKQLSMTVKFLKDQDITDESVEEAVGRLKSLYIENGYFNAAITAAVEKGNKVKISFFISEGNVMHLRKISFTGNSIPDDVLLKMLTYKIDKKYNDNLLDENIEVLLDFYHALGYLDADIKVKKKDYNDGRDMQLKIVVNEGRQTLIKSVKVTGNKEISADEILKAAGISIDSPFNLVDIGDARYSILSLYRKHGYMDAQVEIDNEFKKDGAHLRFVIKEYAQHVIGKIILSGNRKTKPKIIMREIGFKEGDVYDYSDLLKVKQNLYRLGIFNEVELQAVDTGLKDKGRPVKDIILTVGEGKAGSVAFSLGYGEYEEFRGMLEINYRNLGGYNRSIGFKAEKSSVDERYVFNFREPWLFNKPNLPLKLFLIKEDRRAINIDTREIRYRVDKIGFIAGVEKRLNDRLTLHLNYEYSFTETSDVEEGVVLSRDDIGTLGISSISPSLYYDTRDDPFDPSSGSIHSLVVKLSSNAIFSEVGFLKLTFRSSWFFNLYKDMVLASSVGAGTSFSFEGTKELPLVERYFLGGSTTVRGYEHDMLGPKGEDDQPTGGNIYALVNLELRAPLGQGFGLVTFIDGGNVWTTIDDINQDLRYTAGAGLRYKTPVGPVRIDYGHKLSQRPDESAGEVHFSIGHAF